MLMRRVLLGASIVGVVGAAVALTALAIGPQVDSDSVASPGLDTTPLDTAPLDGPLDPESPSDAEPAETASLDTGPRSDDRPPAASSTAAATVAPNAMVAFADASTCPADGRAAVVDRENQRAWLCGDGLVTREMPITSAWIQPDPGDYAIYAKDMNSSSRLTGEYSTMTHFVAFTYGKIRGARIAFHSMPIYADGSFVQPLESLGMPEQRGLSAGCIRVSPADAELVWSWLEIGDLVRVVS